MPIIFLRAPIHGWPCRPIGQQVRGHDPRTHIQRIPRFEAVVPPVPLNTHRAARSANECTVTDGKCVASAAQSKVRPPALRQYLRYSPPKIAPIHLCTTTHQRYGASAQM